MRTGVEEKWRKSVGKEGEERGGERREQDGKGRKGKGKEGKGREGKERKTKKKKRNGTERNGREGKRTITKVETLVNNSVLEKSLEVVELGAR